MSAFEDYTRTAESYDATRRALGVEVILGCLAAARRRLHDQVVLDAGCGTGSYARALVDHVGQLLCVDLNEAMLRRAADKLRDAIGDGRARLHRADLAALPLRDASVDAAMINQVLHHMPDSREQGWPMRRRVFRELARVLRRGGVLTVNTCLPEQIRESWWYMRLVPVAAEAMCARHQSLAELTDSLHDAGFRVRGRIVPVDAVLQGEHYFDTHGPERAQWRDGDSLWAEVSREELEQALSALRSLHENGRIHDYVAAHDLRREELGQITFVHATLDAD
jgi:ubiquinone/menaquinone biosynthesis C-methylase UbiE